MNVDSKNWAAWHDKMANGSPVVRVHGDCTFPSAGYSVELQRRDEQGAPATNLVLEMIVREARDQAAPVETVHPADYVLEETDVSFRTVTIVRPGGEPITLDVSDEAPRSMERAA